MTANSAAKLEWNKQIITDYIVNTHDKTDLIMRISCREVDTNNSTFKISRVLKLSAIKFMLQQHDLALCFLLIIIIIIFICSDKNT